MQVAKARRGRPKGTGIDDTDRIMRVVELIRLEPGLRPTTAIKQMGISDPSAIRRIRDKYNRHIRIAGISPVTTGATTWPSTTGQTRRQPVSIAHPANDLTNGLARS